MQNFNKIPLKYFVNTVGKLEKIILSFTSLNFYTKKYKNAKKKEL